MTKEQKEKKFLKAVGRFFRTLWSILSTLPGIVAGMTLIVSAVAGFFFGSKASQPSTSAKSVRPSPSAAVTSAESPVSGDPVDGGSAGVGSGDASGSAYRGSTSRRSPAEGSAPVIPTVPRSVTEPSNGSGPSNAASPTVAGPAGEKTVAPAASAPLAASGTGLAGYALGGHHVLYVDTSQHVQELFRSKDSTRWEHYDQSQLVGAPRAARNSGLAGYTLGGVNYAAYLDEQGHVRGLEWTPTVHKAATDLTVAANAPVAASGTGLAGYDLGGHHVLYIDTNLHVQELFRDKGSNRWEHYDQSQLVGAPRAARNSGLAAYAYNGVNYAAYVDEQGHVQKLEWTPTVHKAAVDLTISANAVPAAFGAGLAGYILGGQHVLYVDVNRHVQALWLGDGASSWEVFDHTAAAAVSPAAPGSGLAGYALNGVNYAAYLDDRGRVQGLEWTPNGTKPVPTLTG